MSKTVLGRVEGGTRRWPIFNRFRKVVSVMQGVVVMMRELRAWQRDVHAQEQATTESAR